MLCLPHWGFLGRCGTTQVGATSTVVSSYCSVRMLLEWLRDKGVWSLFCAEAFKPTEKYTFCVQKRKLDSINGVTVWNYEGTL